jgi:ribose transport system substrate-binding protein
MEAVIADKPDILIVQSLTVQLLAKQIKRAEAAGIPVIQLNMGSVQNSTALVGVDWYRLGTETGQEITRQCGKGSGRSGKVAVIQGDITAADSFIQLEGLKSVLAQHPEITIVANQSGQWDPNKAHDIASTVLQQNPDLCAFYGLWGVMDMGVAQAIKDANLKGKIYNYSNDGGSRYACEAVKSGAITKFWSYDAPRQARDVMTFASYLLQVGFKPGEMKGVMFSPITSFTKDTVKDYMCWDPPKS